MLKMETSNFKERFHIKIICKDRFNIVHKRIKDKHRLSETLFHKLD